jgi:hypothetical protein
VNFLIWLEGTPPAEWVLYSALSNPLLLSMHAIGMALVVGCGFMTAARVLGYARELPLSLFSRLLVIAWIGVTLNVTSGVLLFISNGHTYIANVPFDLKILSIIGAGIASHAMWRALAREAPADGASYSTRTQGVAMAVIALWLGAIVAGRMIAYTLTPVFGS